ncbi:MAG: nucleotidyltransferase substrate binding protein [Gammaproteobacteria bacterium]|nr:nucleotidyltransferase substrate binding protein [Gammaproteobacteria bacterium]
MKEIVRWVHCFGIFQNTIKQLDRAVALMAERELSELERQGVIQAFEYNYELAWNVIKDFYQTEFA